MLGILSLGFCFQHIAREKKFPQCNAWYTPENIKQKKCLLLLVVINFKSPQQQSAEQEEKTYQTDEKC